ncbi:MAG: FAD-linked oxidase C-terminal domain-containing protein, partial [Nevskiales bacterium]
PRQIAALKAYLKLRGVGKEFDGQDGQCMLMMGITGTPSQCRNARREALDIATRHGGVHVGRSIGKSWAQNRFKGPYLRNTLWEAGYAADTAETSVDWDKVTPCMRAIEQAAHDALGQHGEKVHAFTHLSHVYAQGSSIYSTFIFRAGADRDETYARWQILKRSVSEVMVEYGGTISHQHGVGVDHKPYLPAEKKELGISAIQTLSRHFDPDGMMNPGKLVD